MVQRKRPETVCYYKQLKYATSAVARYYGRMLEPAGVSAQQFSLLADIEKIGPCSLADLAWASRLDQSTITRNLRHLRDLGYVADSSPRGARERRIILTPLGTEKAAECRSLWQKAQAGIRAALGEENLAQLGRFLQTLEALPQP